jgi:hypothetical protein
VFALHAQAHSSPASSICTTANPNLTDPPLACTDYTTSWPLGVGADMYLVVAHADSEGVGGITFGITYGGGDPGMGLKVVNWTLCATGLEFVSDGWPDPNTGNVIIWLLPTGCARQVIGEDGVHAVAGAFYVYAYDHDLFSIREHSKLMSEERMAISDCSGGTTVLNYDEMYLSGRLARVGFGAFTDWSCGPCIAPCYFDPVLAATWGGIKTRYRN